jgi:hypothetical protein
MAQDDLDYFRQREAQERHAATHAEGRLARDVHLQLAERYADRCWSIDEGYPASPPRFAE